MVDHPKDASCKALIRTMRLHEGFGSLIEEYPAGVHEPETVPDIRVAYPHLGCKDI